MNKKEFYDTVMDLGNNKFTITFYNGDEINGRFKMYADSINEYDDEIIIYGTENDFVILNTDKIETMTDEDETEFLFGSGDQKIGVVIS